MTEETKDLIREALNRQERWYRSSADSSRMDALHCSRSGNADIQAKADSLREMADDSDRRADAYKSALEEFENASGMGREDETPPHADS